MIHTEPFIIDTEIGQMLVLKAVKLCKVRTVACNSGTASCVLKVDKPGSPCARRSPPGSPLTERQVPFMQTNVLADMLSANKATAAKLIA